LNCLYIFDQPDGSQNKTIKLSPATFSAKVKKVALGVTNSIWHES